MDTSSTAPVVPGAGRVGHDPVTTTTTTSTPAPGHPPPAPPPPPPPTTTAGPTAGRPPLEHALERPCRLHDVQFPPRYLTHHDRVVPENPSTDLVQHDPSTSYPQLRKKPRLPPTEARLTGRAHSQSLHSGMRRPITIPKTASVPSFHHHQHLQHQIQIQIPIPIAATDAAASDPPRPSSSSSSSSPGEPSSPVQGTAGPPVQRSPPQKKPPASHSSYGVETTCGPPPSFTTQRTLSQDRIRPFDRTSTGRPANPPQPDAPHKPNEPGQKPEPALSPSIPVPAAADPSGSSTDSLADDVHTRDASSPETAHTSAVLTPLSTMNRSLNASSQTLEKDVAALKDPIPAATREHSKGSSSDERKSEDLFLNIAKLDASLASQDAARPDRKRSRISLPFFSSSRSTATPYKTSPIQDRDRFDTTSVSGRSEALAFYSKRSSLGHHTPGAFARPHTQDSLPAVDAAEARVETQSNHPGGDVSRRIVSRRYSSTHTALTAEQSRPAPPRKSLARHSRGGAGADAGPPLDRPPRLADHNATESTISTTAPSTVWDELDDLKSRIRKLELTGKLPPSSAAAMSTAERPKTATTAATTTISSSPKHKIGAAPVPSAVDGIPATVHPNLHEALGNARAVVSPELYQKLLATAQDALQLSIMTGTGDGYGTGGTTVGTSSLSERQVRRRAENMCRSLTELVIALLADHKTPPPAPAPPTGLGSRDISQSGAASLALRARRASTEPGDRPPGTSRVQSRLESRRTSMTPGGTPPTHGATPDSGHATGAVLSPQGSTVFSRSGRNSALLRNRRTTGFLDGAADDDEPSPSARPVSRAMTEVGSYRQMARDRAAYSREYTAQHPMPAQLTLSPLDTNHASTRSAMPANVTTNLVSRRKYASSASNVAIGEKHQPPETPKDAWGRISIVPAATQSSPLEATPDSAVSIRPSHSRRSLGFASRISNVSNRLRAAKAERQALARESMDGRPPIPRDLAPSGPELDTTALERQVSRQSAGS